MSSYITTYTGKHFWPLTPDAEKICIEDIAHALSLLCRGNGHVSTFFSVGQHSIYCAREAIQRGYTGKVILACLLHDAGECYLSDIPRPVKDELPEMREIEDRLLDVIYETLIGERVTEEEKALVKEVDDGLLYYDLQELLGEKQSGPAPLLHIQVNYSFVPFKAVEEEFLSLYRIYSSKRERAVVSLTSLVQALEDATEGFDTFVNIYTGGICPVPRVSNVILAPTPEQEEVRELSNTTGEYLLLPGVEEIAEEAIMEGFTEALPNPRDAIYLRGSLSKHHPKRHFRAALEETGHMGAYKEYLERTLTERMAGWCEKNGLSYE